MRHGLVVSLLSLFGAPEALACGGFFCQTVPVNQSAERIVFAVDEGAGETEMHVQVSYSGSAAEFAWIVPVSGTPKLKLTTDALFTALAAQTQPRFYLNYTDDGSCVYAQDSSWAVTDAAFDGALSDSGSVAGLDSGGGPQVNVIAEQRVGPYDTVTLQADTAEVLVTWLRENNYLIPESLTPALAPYVAGGQTFVALRLANDQAFGALPPLALKYPGTTPAIPIQLTAVAAEPDMRLEVFILGKHRYVPENYLHVEINEARVNWLDGGENYPAVVTAAADEAGGRAFATDHFGDTNALSSAIYPVDYDLGSLRDITDPSRYMSRLMGLGVGRNDPALLPILREFIPMPPAVADQGYAETDFYNALAGGWAEWELPDVDGAALTAAIEARYLQPREDAQALVNRYDNLTRLTSSLSAAEMTLDPTFVANPDLTEAVPSQRAATLRVDCAGGEYVASPRRIILADGREIALPPIDQFGAGDDDALFGSDALGPAAARIEITGPSGAPTLVSDNETEIDEDIEQHNEEVAAATPDPEAPAEAGACGGCDGSAGAGWFGLAPLLLLRRRGAGTPIPR
jgi:hypothetical protein